MNGELIEKLMVENGQVVTKYEYADMFSYQFDSGSLAPAASTSITVSVNNSYDFVAEKITAQVINSAGAITFSSFVIPEMTVQFIDLTSNIAFSNDVIPISAIMGNGFLPYYLPVKRRFEKATDIKCIFTNTHGATTYQVKLQLHGYKTWNI